MTFRETSSSNAIGGLAWKSAELALAWRQMERIHATVSGTATERMLTWPRSVPACTCSTLRPARADRPC